MAFELNEIRKRYTGITSYALLAVNPSNALYKKITGRDWKEELNYVLDDNNQMNCRLLLKEYNTGNYILQSIFIGKAPIRLKDGRPQYIDKNFITSYPKIKESENGETPTYTVEDVSYEDFDKTTGKEARTGEPEFYGILNAVMRYKKKNKEDLSKKLKDEGVNLVEIREKFNFKTLNEWLSKKIEGVELTNGEVGFTALQYIKKTEKGNFETVSFKKVGRTDHVVSAEKDNTGKGFFILVNDYAKISIKDSFEKYPLKAGENSKSVYEYEFDWQEYGAKKETEKIIIPDSSVNLDNVAFGDKE